jgi:hypothetical protein
VTGFCEHCNEPSGSIKKGYFLISQVTISFSNILYHGVSSESTSNVFCNIFFSNYEYVHTYIQVTSKNILHINITC